MDGKKLGYRLLLPPVWAMAVLSLISAAGLIWVFVQGLETAVIAYAIYVLAFYTLSVVSTFCALVLPKRYQRIKKRIYSSTFGNRYMTDRAFRTKLSLHISLAVDMLYVLINLWSWYHIRSWWFMVLGVYYGIMTVMRSLLVLFFRRNEIGDSVLLEWKRARACACILLLINLCLSGAVLMILYSNRGYDYPGILIYVMALYTFYSAIHAGAGIVRYRKMGSPVMSTAKVISLSSGLVSMLNLETAMFAQFGAEMAQADQQLMIMLTGAGISIVVITMSVMLIVKATKAIRGEKDGK